MYRFERISLKYAPSGHTYMACDRAFGNVSKQTKKREVIGDPKELMEVINDDCKNTTAQWVTANSISIGGATLDNITAQTGTSCGLTTSPF